MWKLNDDCIGGDEWVTWVCIVANATMWCAVLWSDMMRNILTHQHIPQTALAGVETQVTERVHVCRCARVRAYKWGNGRLWCALALQPVCDEFTVRLSSITVDLSIFCFQFALMWKSHQWIFLFASIIPLFWRCVSFVFHGFHASSDSRRIPSFLIDLWVFVDLHLFCWFYWFWEDREEGWAGVVHIDIFYTLRPKNGERGRRPVSEQIAACPREWAGEVEMWAKSSFRRAVKKWCPFRTADGGKTYFPHVRKRWLAGWLAGLAGVGRGAGIVRR